MYHSVMHLASFTGILLPDRVLVQSYLMNAECSQCCILIHAMRTLQRFAWCLQMAG